MEMRIGMAMMAYRVASMRGEGGLSFVYHFLVRLYGLLEGRPAGWGVFVPPGLGFTC